jgi:DNA repair exonuclease SbcCD ATPase subunit
MDGAPPCCGPPPGDAGGVYAHLVSMKLLDKPANEYASRLIEDGYDTPEAVDELSLEELSEDLGFKKGHLKAVERWRGGGGGRSVADGAESAAAQELRAANEALKAEKDAMELAHRKEKAEADERLKRLTKELGDAVDSDEAREAQLQESQAEVAQLKSQLAASTAENLELKSDLQKAMEEIEAAPAHEDHEELQRELRKIAQQQLDTIDNMEARVAGEVASRLVAADQEKQRLSEAADELRRAHQEEVAAHSETRAHMEQLEQLMTELTEEHTKNGADLEEVHSQKEHIVELEDSLREAVAVVAELRKYYNSAQFPTAAT